MSVSPYTKHTAGPADEAGDENTGVELARPAWSLYISSPGDIVCEPVGQTDSVTFRSLLAGTFLPVMVREVNIGSTAGYLFMNSDGSEFIPDFLYSYIFSDSRNSGYIATF